MTSSPQNVVTAGQRWELKRSWDGRQGTESVPRCSNYTLDRDVGSAGRWSHQPVVFRPRSGGNIWEMWLLVLLIVKKAIALWVNVRNWKLLDRGDVLLDLVQARTEDLWQPSNGVIPVFYWWCKQFPQNDVTKKLSTSDPTSETRISAPLVPPKMDVCLVLQFKATPTYIGDPWLLGHYLIVPDWQSRSVSLLKFHLELFLIAVMQSTGNR